MATRRSTTYHSPPATRRAITLVEMLISMAVTLVMMAAVVNLFANIGSGVRNRRASMELGSQLRTARARLFKDLAGATSPARPKLPSDDHDDGYLEIIEGQYSDKNPSALVNGIDTPGSRDPELDYDLSIIPAGNPAVGVQTDALALGDYDDVLALTVQSESEPFTGRMPVWRDSDGDGVPQWEFDIIESDLAEVIWYAVENPYDGSNGEPGMRTVYRRVLLIAPWVAELPPESSSTEPAKQIAFSRTYYQLSDISCRRVLLDPSNPATSDVVRVPNTLADLTRRENRFGHFAGTPHQMNLRAIRNRSTTDRNNFPEFTPLDQSSVLIPFGLPFEWDLVESFTLEDQEDSKPEFPPGTSDLGDDRTGEDVMLNDVLAFDLRVFDSEAPLLNFNASTPPVVVEPSDAGWRYNPNLAAPVHPVVGTGSFVDIGYWSKYVDYANLLGLPLPADGTDADSLPDNNIPTVFSEAPNPKSQIVANAVDPVIYDTWPYHYETDGIDQDNWDGDNDNSTGADEGTDGLDSIRAYDLDNDPSTPDAIPTDSNNDPIGLYGPDDVGERELPPPYNHPLRAMQAKIRVYDRETRQIREATVTRNFVPQ